MASSQPDTRHREHHRAGVIGLSARLFFCHYLSQAGAHFPVPRIVL
jgi:hypothetical protein